MRSKSERVRGGEGAKARRSCAWRSQQCEEEPARGGARENRSWKAGGSGMGEQAGEIERARKIKQAGAAAQAGDSGRVGLTRLLVRAPA
eukprot:3520782-Pleurochrysis_carterae.AAC.1